MSILLDALKKSETQRQLGKTPTIHTAVDNPASAKETERRWIALSLLALSAIAIAWFGWQQFRPPVDTPDKSGVDVVAVPRMEESPVVETRVPMEKTEPGSTNRKPAASLWDMKKDLGRVTYLPAENTEEAQKRRETLSQSFNSYEAEKKTATDQESRSSLATVGDTSSGPAVAQPTLSQSLDAAEVPLETATRSSPRMQPHQAEPISFWQIPQALRDGLPEFKINVLVYAENPEDRFLLINGQRLVEKEEIVSGVVLDEIRRDGAVFRYRNYRFLVKG